MGSRHNGQWASRCIHQWEKSPPVTAMAFSIPRSCANERRSLQTLWRTESWAYFPKLYTWPSLTGIISGEGSKPCCTKSGSYLNCEISYLWSQRTESMGWPYRLHELHLLFRFFPIFLCNLWMLPYARVYLLCWPTRSIHKGSTALPRWAGRRSRACPRCAGCVSATRSVWPFCIPCALFYIFVMIVSSLVFPIGLSLYHIVGSWKL